MQGMGFSLEKNTWIHTKNGYETQIKTNRQTERSTYHAKKIKDKQQNRE